MYKNIGITFFTICISTGLTMASTTIDTILITDMPAEVETVAVTKTNVETVTVVKDITPSATEIAQPVVKEEPVKTQEVSRTGTIRIQFGAFNIKENAEKLYNLLKTQYGDIFYMENINSYWKVGAQNYTTLKSAKAAKKTFISQGFTTIFITH